MSRPLLVHEVDRSTAAKEAAEAIPVTEELLKAVLAVSQRPLPVWFIEMLRAD